MAKNLRKLVLDYWHVVMVQSHARIIYTQYGWERLGGLGMWLPMVAGFIYERGKIMISSRNNSGGVVVGALCAEQNIVGSTLTLYTLICFHFSKFF